jgi:hypothetical protein
MTTRWRGWLDDAAADWDVGQGTIACILVLPLAVLLMGAVAALMGKDAYKWLVQEDGVAENLQAIIFAASAVVSMAAGRRLRRTGDSHLGFLFFLMGAGLVLVAGEEMSWGQRIFGIETPDALDAINRQGELNLHNIPTVEKTLRLAQFLTGVWGSVLPLVVLHYAGRLSRWRRQLATLVPHHTLIVYFGCTMVWRAYRALHPAPTEYAWFLAEWSEVVELNLALGILLYLVYQLRRSTQRAVLPCGASRAPKLRVSFASEAATTAATAKKNGVLIALMGPDGAGKTTLARRLSADGALRARRMYMGRNLDAQKSVLPLPRWLRGVRPGADTRLPPIVHQLAKCVGFCCLLADQWLSYIAARRHQRNGGVVLFDRYIYDPDPNARGRSRAVRLRRWLLHAGAPLPHVVVILDASPEVLYARKPEHPIPKLQRMRNAKLVDAGQDMDTVCMAVASLIRASQQGGR